MLDLIFSVFFRARYKDIDKIDIDKIVAVVAGVVETVDNFFIFCAMLIFGYRLIFSYIILYIIMRKMR